MHKLMRYIKGYEKQAVLAPLFKMLEATFELFVPLVVASIIDTGIKNGDAVFIWQRCGLLIQHAELQRTGRHRHPDIGHPHDQRHQPGAERRKPDAAPAAA